MSAFRQAWFYILSLIALAIAPLGLVNAQVSVTAADPSSALQGTLSLDVTVTGNGFNSTAAVKFLVTGTADAGGIVVKKVNVNSAKQLIATIDVANTAVVNKFDIEVALSSGRKGKGTTLFAVQAKGKPVPPPPPPPPPPEPLPPQSCAGAPGVFPAFAYKKDRYKTVISKKGVSSQVVDGSDLFIANSTGSCSIQITRESWGGGLSYRQIGTEARIVWVQDLWVQTSVYSEIRMLKFHVVDGSVVEPRPIPSTSVFVLNLDPSPAGIGGLDLSHDGQTIYYPDEYRSAVDGHHRDSVNMINIATCSANCTPQRIYTFADDNGAGGLEVNDADNRLYLSIHDRVPNIRTVSFLEKQGSTWSAPLLRHVVSNQDAAYLTVNGFANVAVGKWDYDNDATLNDVVSFVVERTSGNTIDMIDVSNCAASGVTSCLRSGESTVRRSGIAGTSASFTFPPDSAANLLVTGAGGWVNEVDLDSPTVTPLVIATDVDSAD